ncbi:MAG: hypothetical protein JWM07_200 [Candidatus Saccharibacteria bacterium]|nr:hypothetical protein [Candidatus Saccharibacteria bacterium]
MFSVFSQTCPYCHAAFQQSEAVSQLIIFLASPVCNSVVSKCPGCYKNSTVYLTTEAVIVYMSNLRLTPLIKNKASNDLIKHAVETLEATAEKKAQQDEYPTEPATFTLTPRLEDVLKQFSDELENFGGIPLEDPTVVTDAEKPNHPVKWTE